MPEPILDLTTLQEGMPALTASAGSQLAEAAAVCLDEQGHGNEMVLNVTGKWVGQYRLLRPSVTDQMRRCYNDADEATEWGACAVSLLLLKNRTGFAVVERSRRGTGFDYWLGDGDEAPFQHKARLEVSGIRHGDAVTVSRRVARKRRQTGRTTASETAYIAVVEFGHPAARVEER